MGSRIAKGLLALLAAGMLFQVTVAWAAEKEVTGTVEAGKDDEGNVTSAVLTTDDGTRYQVTMDATGKKMATEMDGKKVKATGDVQGEADKTIRVSKYAAVAE